MRVVCADYTSHKMLAAMLMACTLQYGKEVDEIVKTTQANMRKQSTNILLEAQLEALKLVSSDTNTNLLSKSHTRTAAIPSTLTLYFETIRLAHTHNCTLQLFLTTEDTEQVYELSRRLVLSHPGFSSKTSFLPFLRSGMTWAMESVERFAFLEPALKPFIMRSSPEDVAET